MSSGDLKALSNGALSNAALSSERPPTDGAATCVVSHNAAATHLKTPLPAEAPQPGAEPAREVGGRGGLEPTRYGDWEKNGRCVDF